MCISMVSRISLADGPSGYGNHISAEVGDDEYKSVERAGIALCSVVCTRKRSGMRYWTSIVANGYSSKKI